MEPLLHIPYDPLALLLSPTRTMLPQTPTPQTCTISPQWAFKACQAGDPQTFCSTGPCPPICTGLHWYPLCWATPLRPAQAWIISIVLGHTTKICHNSDPHTRSPFFWAVSPRPTEACTIFTLQVWDPKACQARNPCKHDHCSAGTTPKSAQTCMISTLPGHAPKACNTSSPHTHDFCSTGLHRVCTALHWYLLCRAIAPSSAKPWATDIQDPCWAIHSRLHRPAWSLPGHALRPAQAYKIFARSCPQACTDLQNLRWEHAPKACQAVKSPDLQDLHSAGLVFSGMPGPHSKAPLVCLERPPPVGPWDQTHLPPATGWLPIFLWDTHRHIWMLEEWHHSN
jgi:hypothetical protein